MRSATRRSEKVTSRPREYCSGLFITVFQQLTCDHTCSHLSVAALICPTLTPCSLNSYPRALFSYKIGRMPCTFTLFPSALSLTRGTRNKQAIYISRHDRWIQLSMIEHSSLFLSLLFLFSPFFFPDYPALRLLLF